MSSGSEAVCGAESGIGREDGLGGIAVVREMLMRILSLDLGTKTGWALWDGARMESGVQDFTKQRGESNGMLFLKFNRWLAAMPPDSYVMDGIRPQDKFDLIVFEQAHHRGGAATEIAVGLMTRVLEFCARYGIEHTSVHSASLKKFATGRGNADKDEMIERLRRRGLVHLDYIPGNDEADALWLLIYALEKFGGVPSNAQPAAAGKIESLEPSTKTG
jgi:hypothetical protein